MSPHTFYQNEYAQLCYKRRMSIFHAVVPIAGKGTRMRPLSDAIPKEMLPLGRRPVLEHVLNELKNNGFTQVRLVTNESKSDIARPFADDASLEISTVLQAQQRGLGDAILQSRGFSGDAPFCVALGDSILGLNGQSRALTQMRMIYENAARERAGCAAVVAFRRVPRVDVSRYGVAQVEGEVRGGESFRVLDVVEKPAPDDASSEWAIAARYIFSPRIYDALEQIEVGKNGELQLTDAIHWLIESGERVFGYALTNVDKRYDIGNFPNYFEAFLEFALADEECGTALRQHAQRLLKQN